MLALEFGNDFALFCLILGRRHMAQRMKGTAKLLNRKKIMNKISLSCFNQLMKLSVNVFFII